MKILSILLIAISVFLSVRHAWASFHIGQDPNQVKMMAELGISKTYAPVMGIIILIAGIMLLFPQTFFIGNLLNAISILFIMALALNAGNLKMAMIEIPFLAMPLALIWLKYPFKF